MCVVGSVVLKCLLAKPVFYPHLGMAHLASGCCHCAHCGKSSLTSTAIYSHMGIYNLALFCVFIVLTVENVY